MKKIKKSLSIKSGQAHKPRKPLKFHFITLSNTFFLMPKVKLGKETVKFVAIFDHVSFAPLPPLFPLLAPVKFPVFIPTLRYSNTPHSDVLTPPTQPLNFPQPSAIVSL
jgi:hypothetical protein